MRKNLVNIISGIAGAGMALGILGGVNTAYGGGGWYGVSKALESQGREHLLKGDIKEWQRSEDAAALASLLEYSTSGPERKSRGSEQTRDNQSRPQIFTPEQLMETVRIETKSSYLIGKRGDLIRMFEELNAPGVVSVAPGRYNIFYVEKLVPDDDTSARDLSKQVRLELNRFVFEGRCDDIYRFMSDLDNNRGKKLIPADYNIRAVSLEEERPKESQRDLESISLDKERENIAPVEPDRAIFRGSYESPKFMPNLNGIWKMKEDTLIGFFGAGLIYRNAEIIPPSLFRGARKKAPYDYEVPISVELLRTLKEDRPEEYKKVLSWISWWAHGNFLDDENTLDKGRFDKTIEILRQKKFSESVKKEFEKFLRRYYFQDLRRAEIKEKEEKRKLEEKEREEACKEGWNLPISDILMEGEHSPSWILQNFGGICWRREVRGADGEKRRVFYLTPFNQEVMQSIKEANGYLYKYLLRETEGQYRRLTEPEPGTNLLVTVERRLKNIQGNPEHRPELTKDLRKFIEWYRFARQEEGLIGLTNEELEH